MKKRHSFMLLASCFLMLPLILSGCGGGGAGPANVPAGESPGTPAVVQLNPVNYIAQTGASIQLEAKILDSNGIVVPNAAVTFSNLSSTGSLTSAGINTASSSRSATVTATTNSLGIAAAWLNSGITGFATIQAQIGSGISIIRDQKTVYFSSYSLSSPTTYVSSPYMILDVDGNGNGTYNETNDSTLFQSSGDNQVVVRATVYDSSGIPAADTIVTFGADRPYKVSGTCSGGVAACDVSFPNGNTPKTDSSGRAYVLVQVDPSILTSLTTVLNITASAGNGAANMGSLFLNPVTLSSISVTAAPTVIYTDASSTIIASLKTSLGTPAPDGTTVSFSSDCGYTTTKGQINPPFAQTTTGSASSTFTAPSSSASCYVSATSGGITASTTVSVTTTPTTPTTTTPAALAIVPGAASVVSSTSAQTISFAISGGTGTYTTTSSDPSKAFYDANGNGVMNTGEGGTWSGSPITVTIPANVAAGTVTLNVYDSSGSTKTATITILGGSGTGATLSVSPSSISVTGLSTTADQITFAVTGGTSPYSVFSTNTAVIPSITNPLAGSTFTINPNPVAASTAVTLTVMDSLGATKTVTVTVTPSTSALAINPTAISMTGGSSTTFYIIGGVGPFNIVSGSAKATLTATTGCVAGGTGVATLTGCSITSFTVNTTAGAGSAVITVIDTGDGISATSTVTVN